MLQSSGAQLDQWFAVTEGEVLSFNLKDNKFSSSIKKAMGGAPDLGEHVSAFDLPVVPTCLSKTTIAQTYAVH